MTAGSRVLADAVFGSVIQTLHCAFRPSADSSVCGRRRAIELAANLLDDLVLMLSSSR